MRQRGECPSLGFSVPTQGKDYLTDPYKSIEKNLSLFACVGEGSKIPRPTAGCIPTALTAMSEVPSAEPDEVTQPPE